MRTQNIHSSDQF